MATNHQLSKYQPHLLLPENTTGRDFIVSDLHGHRERLETALSKLKFSPQQDRLISVGDLIDRGPDSPGCLDLLQEPWFWAVRGNHEQMLIETEAAQTDALWSRWLMNGGSWVLQQPDIAVKNWAEQLKYLPITITLPCQDYQVGICHAEYTDAHWGDRHNADDDATINYLWGRTRLKSHNNQPINGVDWVFSGHTIVSDVKTLGNSVFIERGAYLDNPLTIIDLQHWLIGR
jgi:serine/threonine protein phosphatase 1